jgi:hypothetical protein
VLCISNVSGPQSERFKGYLIGIGPKEGHVAVRRGGVGVYTYDDRTGRRRHSSTTSSRKLKTSK